MLFVSLDIKKAPGWGSTQSFTVPSDQRPWTNIPKCINNSFPHRLQDQKNTALLMFSFVLDEHNLDSTGILLLPF